MLNNTDSVLKKGEVEGAIQDYEALFAGARTEVGYVTHYCSYAPPAMLYFTVSAACFTTPATGSIEKGCVISSLLEATKKHFYAT